MPDVQESCKLCIAELDTDKLHWPVFLTHWVHTCLPPCRMCKQVQTLQQLKSRVQKQRKWHVAILYSKVNAFCHLGSWGYRRSAVKNSQPHTWPQSPIDSCFVLSHRVCHDMVSTERGFENMLYSTSILTSAIYVSDALCSGYQSWRS